MPEVYHKDGTVGVERRAMRSIITRIQIENYKSIRQADVPLTDLTILIGPNGSGKSVFLEALTLIADALRNDLNHTLSGQGDIRPFRAPNARVLAPIPPFLQEYAPPESWRMDTRSTRVKLETAATSRRSFPARAKTTICWDLSRMRGSLAIR